MKTHLSYYVLRSTICLIFTLLSASLFAQNTDEKIEDFGTGEEESGPHIDKLHLEARMGWEGERLDGSKVDERSGFKGQYFNLRFDGQIVKNLTFSYRQRLNKSTNQTFWDATDWVHLDWKFAPKWTVSGGKQVVAIGGYEYDRAPIDLYYCSEFWNQIPCYQIGLSSTYQASAYHTLTLQLCNTPFRHWTGNNKYALNLLWSGSTKWWDCLWSVNAMQTIHGKWMQYTALGNRFNMGGVVRLDVDYLNRYTSGQSFFKDFSIMSELSFTPILKGGFCDGLRLFCKYTYDQNKSCEDADVLITSGTSMHSVGVGLEFLPISKKEYHDAVRVFGAAAYCWGTNSNTDAVLCDKQLKVQCGVKFRLDIIQNIMSMFKSSRR